jgi:hypothetical protein
VSRPPLGHAAAAARWAARSAESANRQLAERALDDIALDPAPPLPRYTRFVVRAVLVRSRSKCLTSALVRQAWWMGQDRPRAVLIGVWKEGELVEAHAWLEGDREDGRNGWPVMRRLQPR